MSQIIEPSSSFLTNLYQTVIFNDQTYEEHKKMCEFGCSYCSFHRKREQRILSDYNKSVAGVAFPQVQRYRQMIERHSIRQFCPSQEDIRGPHGELLRWVYLALQYESFSDREIQRYFHINNHEWQNFKRREFPNWLDTKEDILNTEGAEAYQRLVREQNFHTHESGKLRKKSQK